MSGSRSLDGPAAVCLQRLKVGEEGAASGLVAFFSLVIFTFIN